MFRQGDILIVPVDVNEKPDRPEPVLARVSTR